MLNCIAHTLHSALVEKANAPRRKGRTREKRLHAHATATFPLPPAELAATIRDREESARIR